MWAKRGSFSQYRPPTSSARATTAAHTEVAGPLRDGLPVKSFLPSAACWAGSSGSVVLRLASIWRSQLGTYATRMDRRGSHSSVTVSFVNSHREKYCSPSCLRPYATKGQAVRSKFGSPGRHSKSMTGRCQIGSAAHRVKERCDAVTKDEVAQMIAAELRLESISGMPNGVAITPALANDYVERVHFLRAVHLRRRARSLRSARSSSISSNESTLVSASWRTCSVAVWP